MVSSPTFDPRVMIGRQRGKNHLELERNPQKPLLTVRLWGLILPVLLLNSAGIDFLQEGVIQANTLFPCSHGFVHAGLRVGCHAHPAPLPLIRR